MGLPPSEAGAVQESETPLDAAGAAVSCGGPGTFAGVVTVIEALPEMPAAAATSVPLPAVAPAVNVVELPAVGAIVPRPAGVRAHVASEVATTFPYASAPPAVNIWVPPTVTEAVPGDTVSVASGPGLTVSVWVPLLIPVALAASVGLPAFVSS